MEQMILGLSFAGLGGAFVVGAALVCRNTRGFVREAASAVGEVIGLHENRGDGVTYAPVIRFNTAGGRPFEFTDATSARPPGYRVGQRVKILYHSRNPRRARVASPSRLYMAPIIFGGVGAIFFVTGLVMAAYAAFG